MVQSYTVRMKALETMMDDMSAALAGDAARESVRFFASADDLYAWVNDKGKAFVEQNFAGRLSRPFAGNDAKRLAIFEVDGGSRVGALTFRYRVEPLESIPGDDRPISDLYVEAVWSKPRLFADTSKAGVAISDAKWGLWNRAEQQFERAPD